MSEERGQEAGTRNFGIVYILTNEAMPGYIKIGRTSGGNPDAVTLRMRDLDKTGTPRPFRCEYAAVVDNAAQVERAMHVIFGDRRVRDNREFFEGVTPARARAALGLVEIYDVTPSEAVAPELNADGTIVGEKPPRRPPFRFSMAEIHAGAVLRWAYDPSITCEVVDDRQVTYQGSLYRLSGLAQKLLNSDVSVQGTLYWMYDEETLDERRRRLEGADD